MFYLHRDELLDISFYTSKPLKDFIYESNQGKDVFFPATKEDAVERLVSAPSRKRTP